MHCRPVWYSSFDTGCEAFDINNWRKSIDEIYRNHIQASVRGKFTAPAGNDRMLT